MGNKTRKVMSIDPMGLVEFYDTVLDASIAERVTAVTIYRALCGIRETAAGKKWRYVDKVYAVIGADGKYALKYRDGKPVTDDGRKMVEVTESWYAGFYGK